MRTTAHFFIGCVLGVFLHGTSLAHEGVTWPFPQVPDPSAMTIDGNDDDWDWFEPRICRAFYLAISAAALAGWVYVALRLASG